MIPPHCFMFSSKSEIQLRDFQDQSFQMTRAEVILYFKNRTISSQLAAAEKPHTQLSCEPLCDCGQNIVVDIYLRPLPTKFAPKLYS